MQTSRDKTPAIAGSTILMGLAIMSLATFGIAAWVSLLGSRAAFIEGLETATKHRIVKLNARSLAEEYLYRNALTKLTSTGATITMPGGEGVITIPPMTAAPLASVSLPGGVVRTGLADGYGYHIELPVTMDLAIDHDNDAGTAPLTNSIVRDFLLKSRAPQLAGDLMVMHRPTLSPSVTNNIEGQIRVYGNTIVWPPELSNAVDGRVRTERYAVPTTNNPGGADTIRDLSGSWFPPSNYALMANTGGDFGIGNGYEGTLNVIDPGTAPWSMKNSILAGSHIALSGDVAFDSGRGAKSDGAGTIDITLDDIHLTNVIITDEVTTINLHGQDNDADFAAANLRGAVAILFLQSSLSVANLTRINFNERNNRRVVLGLKKDLNLGQVDLTFPDAGINPTWRMIIVAENIRMRENGNPDGTVTMYGGVRTDRDFRWDNSTNRILELRRETDPKLLERLVPRTAWIESYAD